MAHKDKTKTIHLLIPEPLHAKLFEAAKTSSPPKSLTRECYERIEESFTAPDILELVNFRGQIEALQAELKRKDDLIARMTSNIAAEIGAEVKRQYADAVQSLQDRLDALESKK